MTNRRTMSDVELAALTALANLRNGDPLAGYIERELAARGILPVGVPERAALGDDEPTSFLPTLKAPPSRPASDATKRYPVQVAEAARRRSLSGDDRYATTVASSRRPGPSLAARVGVWLDRRWQYIAGGTIALLLCAGGALAVVEAGPGVHAVVRSLKGGAP